MKIYDRPGFPNPSRIRIVVTAKGLEPLIDFVSVDLIGAEHKQPAFLAKNPSGVIPVLELDDGTVITESTAITEYLDNLDGHPTLTGTTPLQRAMILMMQKRADDELIDPVGIFFHHGTPGLGPVLQHYKSPEWSGRAEWANRQKAKALAGMQHFNDVLKTRTYVAGDTFSMADITVFAALNFADAAGIALPDNCTSLQAWRARVSELPSVKTRSGQNFLPEDMKRLGF